MSETMVARLQIGTNYYLAIGELIRIPRIQPCRCGRATHMTSRTLPKSRVLHIATQKEGDS